MVQCFEMASEQPPFPAGLLRSCRCQADDNGVGVIDDDPLMGW